MQVKMSYTLDKTIDEELDYSRALDGALTLFNVIKTTEGLPKELQDFNYKIVDDTETMKSEYSFEVSIDSKLLNSQEIKYLLTDILGG